MAPRATFTSTGAGLMKEFKKIEFLDLTDAHRAIYKERLKDLEKYFDVILTNAQSLYASDCSSTSDQASKKKRNGITAKKVFMAILQGLASYGSSTLNNSGAGYTPRLRCSEISSWNNAQVLLQGGYGYLDRDNDGEACEELR